MASVPVELETTELSVLRTRLSAQRYAVWWYPYCSQWRRRLARRRMWTPSYQKYVEHWDAEKRIAAELSKLRRQVKKLHRDIRGDAIPMRNKDAGPSLPTNSERRLRSISSDSDKPEK